MKLKDIRLTNFRNYKELSMIFPPEGAVFEGINGSGKTNILEAIYLLCTGRSQRSANRADMISFGVESSFVEGVFIGKEENSKSASIGFSRDKKVSIRLDGNSVQSFSEWFGNRPVVSFSSDDLMLVMGQPEHRRRFLDLLGSQTDSDYLRSLISYRHWLSCRNHLLTENVDSIQIEIYEEKMAETGSEIFTKRKELISVLSGFFSEFYREISENREKAHLIYRPSVMCDYSSKNEWKNVFYKMLNERRKKDIQSGFSTFGPHRDDIRFLLDQKAARNFGSQGQCRSMVLSLKLSSVLCIEQYRMDQMIFLIDDAVSELDPQRTSRVYPLIENKGQVFIATPVMNSIAGDGLLRCTVSQGKVITK